MAMTVRTANAVAHPIKRKLSALSNTNPNTASLPPNSAHGMIGSDDCILTVALDNTVSGPITLTVWIWSEFAKQWFYYLATAALSSQSVSAGGIATFVLPEQSIYYIEASANVAAGFAYTDGTGLQIGAAPLGV